jgi:transaldolase
MKIFLDTAHPELVNKWARTGLIDGVTTNPTNLSKAGKNPINHVLTLCELMPFGTVHVEVVENEAEAIYLQARQLASLSPNIIILLFESLLKKVFLSISRWYFLLRKD